MVTITKSSLLADIATGVTRKQMSTKYGLSLPQINKIIKMAGLEGTRANVKQFEFVDDTVKVEVDDVVEPIKANEFTGEIINS